MGVRESEMETTDRQQELRSLRDRKYLWAIVFLVILFLGFLGLLIEIARPNRERGELLLVGICALIYTLIFTYAILKMLACATTLGFCVIFASNSSELKRLLDKSDCLGGGETFLGKLALKIPSMH
jgi:hypothetical protein